MTAETKKEMTAPQSTVDAVMYSLRSGTKMLAHAGTRERLNRISEQQLREMCKLLKNRNPSVAKSWTDDEVEKLIMTWAACHD
jgi:hypothetical protein